MEVISILGAGNISENLNKEIFQMYRLIIMLGLLSLLVFLGLLSSFYNTETSYDLKNDNIEYISMDLLTKKL